ncbi:MAG: gluconate 2-dehydrogenase subunit 3 family protein [Cyclobacteriaceae bacterium]|jgi:hypothetical protein|nr:gluconate 2-dehydrogenase subunit 3 family protein [Cyclobacteriaceae bacterium]
MDRRKALKSISLSTGLVISSGTFLSLLQSCQEKDAINWIPVFLSKDDAITVSEIANIILPKTDLPGAIEMSVPQFIDLLMKDVFSDEQNEKFLSGLRVFNKQFEKELDSKFNEEGQEDQQSFVEKLYNLPDSDAQDVLSLVKKKEAPSGQEEKYLMYSFLVTVRDLTIKSYFTSEKIGEEVLSYDPVPGRQQGCVPVEEVGNVWAI